MFSGNYSDLVGEVTGAMKTTESDHSLNHYGYGYKTFIEFSGSLASGQSLAWCYTAPTTKYAHIKNMVLSALGSSARLELLKDATVTVNNGSDVALVNTNHNSDKLAESTIKATPTYNGGIPFEMVEVLIDSTAQSVGTATSNQGLYEKVITKSGGEKYIIKLTNIGTDALTRAWIKMFMYEERQGIV